MDTVTPNGSISTPDEQQSPAWIARVVCQPVRNVRMRSDGIDIWRRFDTLLMSNDLDQQHRIRRVPARRGQWSPPQSGLEPFFSTIWDRKSYAENNKPSQESVERTALSATSDHKPTLHGDSRAQTIPNCGARADMTVSLD
jgi:hypothetical protein